MSRKIFSFGFISAILLSVGLLVLGGLNIQQKRKWVAPDDGCSWIQSDRDIQARLVVMDGPAERAGILPGDTLKAINGRAVESDRHVTKILYEIGVWQKAVYTLERNGTTFESTLVVAGPSPRLLRQRLYLEIIGLLYFLIGVFVLVKRFRAPHAVQFTLVCLVSFVFYVFHYTGKLNTFDWTIFWLGLLAQTWLPPLFLHFCLEFSVRKNWIKRNRKLIVLLYTPGAGLLLAWVAFVYGFLGFIPSPVLLRNLLETAGDF